MERVYQYLTGPRFRQLFEGTIDKFSELKQYLGTERKVHEPRLGQAREKNPKCPLGQRSANFSVRGCRVLGASGCDITVDTVCFQRFEIGFAAVAGVRRGLLRLATKIVLDGLDQGHQLTLIAAALRQLVRDNVWAPASTAAWAL